MTQAHEVCDTSSPGRTGAVLDLAAAGRRETPPARGRVGVDGEGLLHLGLDMTMMTTQ